MARAARERATLVSLRLPRELEDMVDAYAEHEGVNFSEAARRLMVQAFESMGATHTRDEGDGPAEDRGWAKPLTGNEES